MEKKHMTAKDIFDEEINKMCLRPHTEIQFFPGKAVSLPGETKTIQTFRIFLSEQK